MAKAPSAPKRRERPLSPHLSIYRPQISTFTSITHRATGVFLTLGLFVLVVMLWELAMQTRCQCVTGLLHTMVGKIALAAWAAALYYHLFNGIRHLCWDFGKGYTVPTANVTGWLVILLTLAATALSWVLATGGNL